MITSGLIWLGLAAEAAHAARVNQALTDALHYDEQAYYQICGDLSKLDRFQKLQARAQRLSERYNQQYQPNDLIVRYVDRRTEGRCQYPARFNSTAVAWTRDLDAVEREMGVPN